jgi:predicted tellurium resistance membrane protein TerC
MKSVLFLPDAWMAALFAFHSASHAFTVFLPTARAVGSALGVIPADGEAGVAAAVVSVPARHSVTNSFLVLPLACKFSLFALHSAAHALKVLAERVRGAAAGGFGVSAGVAFAAGAAEGSVDSVSARHSVMKSFFFFPLAWMVALLAFHSSSQALTVFAEDGEEIKRLEAMTAANP